MKKTFLPVCLLALCNLTLSAQTGESPRIVHTREKSAIHVPPQEAPAGLKKIYSNLGKKNDLYDDESSWYLAGPNSGVTEFIAIPFTPKSDSPISQVQAAVYWDGNGANQVNLSVYGDSNGTPGTLLAGPVTVTNLPSAGTCCALAVATFSTFAVTGGTQYWVVADTPLSGGGSDFSGGWDMVAKIVPIAFSGGDGWGANTANGLPAAEVLGTIP